MKKKKENEISGGNKEDKNESCWSVLILIKVARRGPAEGEALASERGDEG